MRESKDGMVPEILFDCVHNPGRSQMAEALVRHHAGGRVRVRSAGSAPAQALDPVVVAALAEIDIDVPDASPKRLTQGSVEAAGVVVTGGVRGFLSRMYGEALRGRER